jgi:hypothetical protein
VLVFFGTAVPLVQHFALPVKINASPGETSSLLEHVIDGDAVLEFEMRPVPAPEDIFSFVLIDQSLLHKFSLFKSKGA